MKRLSLVFMLVCASMVTLLSQRSISGTITDEAGETLIGATILVKGTSTGAVTDIDGKYTLTVPEGATTLLISYTGFTSQEVELGASDVVDITMALDVVGLEDVIVIG